MKWKKRSEATQTLRAGCSNGSQKFSHRCRPLPGAAGRPKFNQLEMITTFTYRASLVKIDERNFELLWDPPTNTPTNPHTNRQNRLQYTAPHLSSAQCNESETQFSVSLITHSHGGYGRWLWRFGVAVTRWSWSTQLLYIEPG